MHGVAGAVMPSRCFVIGDIHGCVRTFRRLVTEVIKLTAGDELYLLGDLIDRGPDSKGVLDFIFELRKKGFAVLSIKGNHEDMYLRAGNSQQIMDMWLANGGRATLRSFNADGPADIPHQYHYFLRSLPYYILLKDFVIVHAALNFFRTDPFVDTEAMLWQRDCIVDRARIGGRRLICGHTPVTRKQLEDSLAADRIMLDNGSVFDERPGLGSLAALDLNSMVVFYQNNIDR